MAIHLIIITISVTVSFFVILIEYILALNFYKKRIKIRNRILTNSMGLSNTDQIPDVFIPVKYSSEENYHSYLKFHMWEGVGWLLNKRNEVLFLSEHNSDVIEKRFPRNKASIEMAEMNLLKGGLITWIKISMDGKDYYFTCETGVLAIGSKKPSEKIFDEITSNR